ncbi:MAG: hypothetical protein JST58_19350 [Bacteroidetes bacterium]|nr:hypothetical protein [Bacteroidota bacterium]
MKINFIVLLILVFPNVKANEIVHEKKPTADSDSTAKQFGVYADGLHDDTKALQAYANYCFGDSAHFHGNQYPYLNKPFILPAGVIRTTAPINFYHVHGGVIKGQGRFATTITNDRSTIFHTNGFEYTTVSDFQLASGNKSYTLFDLTWDNSPGGACQSNTFSNIYFQGGRIGLDIGKNGYMGSENLIQNCFFQGCFNGLETANYNALQNTIIGGNFQGCDYGIGINAGSANVYSTGFQANGWDIAVTNSANDCMIINGCRSESANFLYSANSQNMTITGITHISLNKGAFATGVLGSIENCNSLNGYVQPLSGTKIEGCWFGRVDWYNGSQSYHAGDRVDTLRNHTGHMPNKGGKLD